MARNFKSNLNMSIRGYNVSLCDVKLHNDFYNLYLPSNRLTWLINSNFKEFDVDGFLMFNDFYKTKCLNFDLIFNNSVKFVSVNIWYDPHQTSYNFKGRLNNYWEFII